MELRKKPRPKILSSCRTKALDTKWWTKPL